MIGSRHQTATLRRVASTIVFSHHPLTPNWQQTPSQVSKTSIWFDVNPTGISEQTTLSFQSDSVCFVYLTTCLTAVNIAPLGHDKIFVMNLLPNCQKTYTIIYKGKMKKSRTFLFFFSNENPHHTSPNSEESFVSFYCQAYNIFPLKPSVYFVCFVALFCTYLTIRTLFNYQITYTII